MRADCSGAGALCSATSSPTANRLRRRSAKRVSRCAVWKRAAKIRGGRFIAGYVGEQYALPDAIEALRAARRSAEAGDIVEVGAYDPLALAKGLMPGAPPRPLRAAVS